MADYIRKVWKGTSRFGTSAIGIRLYSMKDVEDMIDRFYVWLRVTGTVCEVRFLAPLLY